LRDALLNDELSTPEKIAQLAQELSEHYKNNAFLKCKTMGHIMDLHLKALIMSDLKQL